MGVSTDGQIGFGILLEEGAELPWDEETHDVYGLDTWWLFKSGFVRTRDIWKEDGSAFLDGIVKGDEKYELYYSEKRDWEKEHPCPVEEVNVCSGDYPIIMLCAPGSLLSASRGCPQEIDISKIGMGEKEDEWSAAIVSFCMSHKIDMGEERPKWMLSSYWG